MKITKTKENCIYINHPCFDPESKNPYLDSPVVFEIIRTVYTDENGKEYINYCGRRRSLDSKKHVNEVLKNKKGTCISRISGKITIHVYPWLIHNCSFNDLLKRLHDVEENIH